MTDRGERREEIKLRLEYGKLFVSVLGVVTIYFALVQWQAATKAANLTVYQRMTTEWRDRLRVFIEKPNLRPYFESMKELAPSDPDRDAVLAVADIRLDVADGILTYAAYQGFEGIEGWQNTIANAFRSSPVLCARFHETQSNYFRARIVPIALESCKSSQSK